MSRGNFRAKLLQATILLLAICSSFSALQSGKAKKIYGTLPRRWKGAEIHGDDVHGSGSPESNKSSPVDKQPSASTIRPTKTTTVVSSFQPVPIKPVATVDSRKELSVDNDDDDVDDDIDDEDDDEDITNENDGDSHPAPVTNLFDSIQPITTSTTRILSTTVIPAPPPKPIPTSSPRDINGKATTTERTGPFSPFHETMTKGIFAAVAGGIIVAVITAILLVLFVIFRIKKKDEGSYALDEPKPRPYVGYAYTKASTKEFYA
ncbi:unnamed protein product [Caenorhabditis auriculariae]|uniref:Syndecan n=1 Tax=Caenorhabditis auriculariae TaxID=2777116 RepID=A0A8S1H0N9_9PELO|nr:unnamed protein product [Caenorhabditis auriculariae]